MPSEIWVVSGWDQHGDKFVWPDGSDDDQCDAATKEEAGRTAQRLNRLGGMVTIHREVWDSPAAAYRRPRK